MVTNPANIQHLLLLQFYLYTPLFYIQYRSTKSAVVLNIVID